jgi:hypothetical protein
MALYLNNEEIGISAEVAIAKAFNVSISQDYIMRADPNATKLISSLDLRKIFLNEHIPNPVRHIAEGQNPVDFLLAGGQSLSVKTNQKDIGRAAPQKVGQPTHSTYYEYFKDIIGVDERTYFQDPDRFFKETSIYKISQVIDRYWQNMFDCDFLILFYDVIPAIEGYGRIGYRVFGRSANPPRWRADLFSFTQPTPATWNESNTLKYNAVTLGNFQDHRNRDCFKFRFNMDGILKLIENGDI